jgi:hypothetical protein
MWLVTAEPDKMRLVTAEPDGMRLVSAEPDGVWLVTAERDGMWLMTAERDGMWLVTAEPHKELATDQNHQYQRQNRAWPWLRRLDAGLSPRTYRVQSLFNPCEICGEQSDTRTRFSPSTLGFPCPYHSSNFVHHQSYIPLSLVPWKVSDKDNSQKTILYKDKRTFSSPEPPD